jgi:hypothetical protein
MNAATITAPTAPTQQAPEAGAPGAPEELGGSVEERANALFGPDVIDDGSDEGDETSEAAPAAPDAPKTEEQLIAERKARRAADLEALKAKTREGVDAKSARSEVEQLRRQIEQERQARAGLVDPRGLTPLQILELGQMAGHDPQQMAEALKAARDNPEYAVRKVVDPEIQRLHQQLAQERAQRERFEQQYHSAQEQAAEQHAQQQMVTFASENAATSPYTASFLKAYGPEEFATVIAHVLPNVAGTGPQAVLDEVEDFLLSRHKSLSAWTPTAAAAPQRTSANQPRSLGAATQAPTHVTNQLAQQRSSVVDEDAALQDMPYEERASLIFKRLTR